jgi:large subunit ribosomal protein L29
MPEKKRKPMLEELRGLSDQELADALSNERRKLYELRTQTQTRQLENVAAVPQTKKQIARILTLQNERAMATASEG